MMEVKHGFCYNIYINILSVTASPCRGMFHNITSVFIKLYSVLVFCTTYHLCSILCSSLQGIGDGCHDDAACLALASQDRIGLEAIKSLHRQLDDDANGNVDLSESDEVKKCGLICYVCLHFLINITNIYRV